MEKKKVLFVASEAVPFMKTGGLADVAGTLPKYFDSDKYDVRVMIPKYACMRWELTQQLTYLFNIRVPFCGEDRYVGLFEMERDGPTCTVSSRSASLSLRWSLKECLPLSSGDAPSLGGARRASTARCCPCYCLRVTPTSHLLTFVLPHLKEQEYP